jgi:hypothetical protein
LSEAARPMHEIRACPMAPSPSVLPRMPHTRIVEEWARGVVDIRRVNLE